MVTRYPRWSTGQVARALKMRRQVVAATCRMLKEAGYIDYAPGQCNTRTVIIPFYIGPFRVIKRR